MNVEILSEGTSKIYFPSQSVASTNQQNTPDKGGVWPVEVNTLLKQMLAVSTTSASFVLSSEFQLTPPERIKY